MNSIFVCNLLNVTCHREACVTVFDGTGFNAVPTSRYDFVHTFLVSCHKINFFLKYFFEMDLVISFADSATALRWLASSPFLIVLQAAGCEYTTAAQAIQLK